MNELATVEYTPQQKEIMMETVAKGCKPEQFMLMMELAKKYKLDPFARQIWATPMGIIIGRDGFLTLAHNSGNFDGMETTFDERDGKLFSATCTVYHKKMNHPIRVTVRLNEFYKSTPAWDKMPYVMLQKVAESHSLRRAFSVSGLYDEAELVDNPSEEPENPPIREYVDADYKVNNQSPKQEPAKPPEEEPKFEQKPGFCRCGNTAMPDALRNKFSMSFFDIFQIRIPQDICEKCARAWWSDLMEDKKKKGLGIQNASR
jgi:phage recombination protein Bet